MKQSPRTQRAAMDWRQTPLVAWWPGGPNRVMGVCLKVPHQNQMLSDSEHFGMDVSGLTGKCSEKYCRWDLWRLILSTECFLLDGVVFSNLFHWKSSKVKLPSDLQLIKPILWLECSNHFYPEIQHSILIFKLRILQEAKDGTRAGLTSQ